MRTLSVACALVFGISLLFAGDDEIPYIHKPILDVTATTSGGKTFSVLQFCKEKPTLVTLVYSSCTGICYPFLYVLRDRVADLDPVKNNFQVLVLSFDSSDTKENMASMASAAKVEGNTRWEFATLPKTEIEKFISSVGFTIRYDSASRQYDHLPIVIGVTSEGTIVRILKKYDITSNEFWQMYREIKNDYIPFYKETNNSWVTCFTYNPKDGSFKISWGILVIYFPMVIGFGIVYLLFRNARREKLN